MADLYLQTYQYKYYNYFMFYQFEYDFSFYYETEPIYQNDEIVSWSFKPCLDWWVADDELNVGYLRDEHGNILSFIYTADEVKEGMLYNAPLLDCEISWSSNGYYCTFIFHDYIVDTDVYSREISFLQYDLTNFNLDYTISAPYSYEDKVIFLQDTIDEYYSEIGRLTEENNNLKSSIAAPGSTFELFADAFKPVFDTLNIQIAPSITIGMILAVPIVAGILSFLLRETLK